MQMSVPESIIEQMQHFQPWIRHQLKAKLLLLGVLEGKRSVAPGMKRAACATSPMKNGAVFFTAKMNCQRSEKERT
jgi:hypothetical protein